MDHTTTNLNPPEALHDVTSRLLVSVRSRAEAVTATAAGADIIDVKEPNRGSLGRADITTIREIGEVLASKEDRQSIALSVALGELRELEQQTECELLELAKLLAEGRVDYAKMGLAGLDEDPTWSRRWLKMRERLQPDPSFRWIGVAYADARQARSPAVSEVAAAVQETSAAGLLIDTFEKNGSGLLCHLDMVELRRLRSRLAGTHQILALAGSLNEATIRSLHAGCRPHIFAVRGAACEGGARRSTVCRVAIEQLLAVLELTPAID